MSLNQEIFDTLLRIYGEGSRTLAGDLILEADKGEIKGVLAFVAKKMQDAKASEPDVIPATEKPSVKTKNGKIVSVEVTNEENVFIDTNQAIPFIKSYRQRGVGFDFGDAFPALKEVFGIGLKECKYIWDGIKDGRIQTTIRPKG